MQAKDKTQMTPYLAAINYKRIEMKRLLKEYEDLGIIFLNVEHERITSGDILALETTDTDQGNNKK